MFQSIIEVLQANVVIVGLLVGAVTPLVVSLVQQPSWSKRARQGVSLAIAVAVGFAVTAAAGQVNPADLLSTVIAVWTAAEAFYQKVWKASGIAGAVERATSRPADDAPVDPYDDVLENPDPYDYDYGPEPEGLETK